MTSLLTNNKATTCYLAFQINLKREIIHQQSGQNSNSAIFSCQMLKKKSLRYFYDVRQNPLKPYRYHFVTSE